MDPRTKTLDRVIKYCHWYLNYDTEAQRYLSETRKLSTQTIKDFKIGSFPADYKMLLKHFTEYELMMAGIIKSQDDKIISKFSHNNIIIPIMDTYDRPIGIVGRTLLPDEKRAELGISKYDNTVYPKSNLLFGLNLAKEHIRAKDRAVVVEGNVDVITAHQHGLNIVVASAGAFLSRKQIAILARYTKNIYISFDNDVEGQKAKERILKRKLDGVVLTEKKVPAPYKDLDEYFSNK